MFVFIWNILTIYSLSHLCYLCIRFTSPSGLHFFYLFNKSGWIIHLLSPVHPVKSPLNSYMEIVTLVKARPKWMSTWISIHPRTTPFSHCSLIIPPSLQLTCPTNQKHKSLIEPCFLPILNSSVKLLEKPTELSGPLLYEVIDLDSKPVKVSLDFDEKYLPFYCNLLTRPDFPLCALAWVLKTHKIDWDRYLSREEGGKSFSSPFTL